MVTTRRIALLILAPLVGAIAVVAVIVGFAFAGGSNPAAEFSQALGAESAEVTRLAEYLARCFLAPFQLAFILLVLGLALLIYRRRNRIAQRVLQPLATEAPVPVDRTRFDPLHDDWEQLVKLDPKRHVTLEQLVSSIVVVTAAVVAVILVTGQFVSLTDLALIVTALTSALAWGARLPVSDLLGGVSNLLENNFNIGDRVSYRHFKLDVEGNVEQVNLRFVWLRAASGELITIPYGELRTLRNFSRSTFAGVYVTFPLASSDLQQVMLTLEELAPESPNLLPALLEPWRVVSQDGVLGQTVELSLYGRAPIGREEELQLAMHTLVWEKLRELDMLPAEDQK